MFFFFFSFILFLTAWFGLFLARQHIIIFLICMELLLLVINLNFICYSIIFDDLMGQLYGFFILMVAAAESALGLALVVIYFRLRGGIAISLLTLLKS